jgi:hypothetical protein
MTCCTTASQRRTAGHRQHESVSKRERERVCVCVYKCVCLCVCLHTHIRVCAHVCMCVYVGRVGGRTRPLLRRTLADRLSKSVVVGLVHHHRISVHTETHTQRQKERHTCTSTHTCTRIYKHKHLAHAHVHKRAHTDSASHVHIVGEAAGRKGDKGAWSELAGGVKRPHLVPRERVVPTGPVR